MKKILFAVSVIAALSLGLNACKPKANTDAAHNTENSVEWWGTYTGITPAADAEGINVSLTLNKDLTYSMTTSFIGEEDALAETVTGTFTWSEDGGTITLDKDAPNQYKVGESQIWMLDMEGNVIEGDHADMYILTKQAECCGEPKENE